MMNTISDTRKLCPRSAILFSFQLLIILIIVCSSIYFLAQEGKDKSLWITLLSSSIGYVLPHPVLKKDK